MKRLSIQSKLMIFLLIISLSSIIVTGYVGYTTGKENISKEIFNQMTELQVSRGREIKSLFNNLRNQTIFLAETPTIIEAMKSFRDSFNELENKPVSEDKLSKLWFFYEKSFIPELRKSSDGVALAKTYFPTTNAARYLQYEYIINNPFPLNEKDNLDNARDGSSYSNIHQKFHPFLREIVNRFEVRNLGLIDVKTGNIVYSVKKHIGFGTNLENGPYNNSYIGEVFKDLKQNGNFRSFKISDFQFSPSNYGQPTAYLASPIFDNSTMIGVLVLDLSIDAINRIVTDNFQWEKSGFNQTGEIILVGADNLMRSQSRFLIEEPEAYFKKLTEERVPLKIIERIRNTNSSILLQEINNQAVNRALNGERGTDTLEDYLGVLSLVSYAPLTLEDSLDWVIIITVNRNEILAPIKDFGRKVLVTAVFSVIIITILSLLISRILVASIYALMEGTRKIAAGETDVVVKVKSRDEYYQLAQSFNLMARNLDEQKKSLEKQIQENENLLLKILPAPVAKRLKNGENPIADVFPRVTILYANFVGFNLLCEQIPHQEAISLLNQLIMALDDVTKQYDLEKITNVGTIYIVASSLFIPRLDRNKRILDFALEIMQIVDHFSQEKNVNFDVSIGVHSGSVVGGLLGKTKLSYTILGKTMTIVHHLANHCQPHTILVTQEIYDSLQDIYEFINSDEITIPTIGKLPIWQVKFNS